MIFFSRRENVEENVRRFRAAIGDPGMELVKNPAAMNRFTQLSEEEKRTIVNGALNVTSREEMRAYVYNFIEGYPYGDPWNQAF